MATATTPSTNPQDIVARADEDGVEFIRLWFTDINGQLKSFSVGREELEHALEDGMGFDGSSITSAARSSSMRSKTAWASTAHRSPASTRSRSRT